MKPSESGAPPRAPESPASLGSPPALVPSGALKDRVLAAAAAQPALSRPAMLRQTVTLSVASWLVAFGVFLYAGGPRLTGRPLTLVLGTALGTGAVAALAAWAAFGRGRSSLGRARRLLVPIVVGAPPLILAWKIFWSALYTGAIDEWSSRPGLKCLALSLAIAACPFLAFVSARRRGDPVRPVLTGFAGGLAIGSATALLTDLWCPVAYLPHLLVGHVLPIAILGALGAWLGRQIIALRSE